MRRVNKFLEQKLDAEVDKEYKLETIMDIGVYNKDLEDILPG